jgi:hypothetical protein
MRVIEIDASKWTSVVDFCHALRGAIGAPDWHGSSVDAFVDTMAIHDDINAVKAPYTIRITNAAKLASDVKAEVEIFAGAVNKAAAPDRGSELEVKIEIVV